MKKIIDEETASENRNKNESWTHEFRLQERESTGVSDLKVIEG